MKYQDSLKILKYSQRKIDKQSPSFRSNGRFIDSKKLSEIPQSPEVIFPKKSDSNVGKTDAANIREDKKEVIVDNERETTIVTGLVSEKTKMVDEINTLEFLDKFEREETGKDKKSKDNEKKTKE